jgi:hypothetical protein
VRLSVLAVLLAAVGCGSPSPDPPSAVIQISPLAVCEGDDFATTVLFDASRSVETLAIVPVPGDPVTYEWRFTGAEHLITSGTLRDPMVFMKTAGDRPLHAEVTVRAPNGVRAHALRTLGITIAGAPDAGCGP